eukprot:TRINITY_DN7163_c0_g1_i1.p1 TRINITY_DN7163_c0_g1~~TRINITY_DN7163_c0_g1_i1.p1  ORF type:complete len:603 (-),score=118.63 TRINITY_DN7163_c0_g1_i1:101-1909(-)
MARGCTDVFWLLLSLLALAGLRPVNDYARSHGDYRRLFHGYNAAGELCGVSPAQRLRPLLYYCPDSSGQAVDLKRPVCVAECPSERRVVGECGPWSYGYASAPVAAQFCFPTSEELLRQLATRTSDRRSSGDLGASLAQRLTQLPRFKLALAVAAAVALLLGYCYLALLETCAGLIVWVCLTIILAVPSFAGAYLIWVAKFQGGFDGIPNVGNDQDNFLVGIGCCSLGMVLLAIVCCSMESIDTAVQTVKVSADCLTDEPSLLLGPLFDISSKVVVLLLLINKFLLLLSCGKVEKASGIYRTLSYTDEEKACLVYYVLVIFWAFEFLTALSHFSIAWAVQKWYFTPGGGDQKHAPFLGLPRGYLTGLTCHVGSLLLGSLLIAVVRVARLVLQLVAKNASATREGAQVESTMIRVLACVVACFEKMLAFVTRNAFIEIAVNAKPFCPAAKRALKVVSSQAIAVGIVNGATWIIQVAGIGIIACGGAATTWFMCWHVKPFNDVASEHYVGDPVFVTGVAAAISFAVALAFVLVFDTVSDTILYCLASEELDGGPRRSDGDASGEGAKLLDADGDRDRDRGRGRARREGASRRVELQDLVAERRR